MYLYLFISLYQFNNIRISMIPINYGFGLVKELAKTKETIKQVNVVPQLLFLSNRIKLYNIIVIDIILKCIFI